MSYESVLKGSVHEKSCQSAKKGGGTRGGISTLKPKLATGKEDNVPPNCLFLTIQVDQAKILDKP